MNNAESAMLITATEFIMHSHFTGRIASKNTSVYDRRNENGFNQLTLYRSILISIMSML